MRTIWIFAAALALAPCQISACGGKTSRESGCDGSVCANSGHDDAAPAPWRDAADSLCAASCQLLFAAQCPAGYDVAYCFSTCEQARTGPCGSVFEAAVECLLEHASPKCTGTGAPMFWDPKGACDVPVGIYADCASS